MDELRDGAGNDRVLDDLERDILGAVRGVVTDFVAKRVGRPDLSDVDVDIAMPAEGEPAVPDQQSAPDPRPDGDIDGNDAGAGDPRSDPAHKLGPGTTLLPLLLIFSAGVFLIGAGLFYSHVIVGEIPLVNGTKLQPVAVERQRNEAAKVALDEPEFATTVVTASPSPLASR